MTVWENVVPAVDVVARETMLFAAMGFLLGGIDDLAIDILFLARLGWRGAGRQRRTLADFPYNPAAARIAIFVAAWDEGAVIGRMLRHTAARLDHPSWRLYVGVYPNDRGTIEAVLDAAQRDYRIVPVLGPRNGPTTKADNLNALWRALLRDEAASGVATKAVVLHDAEDLVHGGELRIFDRLVERHCVVQLPVLPQGVGGSPLVSGHYLDEFAESHTKSLIVRQALGASLPLAGTGCAIARDCLGEIAAARGGDPFDAASLTEDYELGLRIATMGGSGILARISERRGGPPVGVRACFPDTLEAAVRQKARWMIGIALAGWDRVGWAKWHQLPEHWMRLRDRRAPLAVLVLAAAYFALVAWAAGRMLHWWSGIATPPLSPVLAWLLTVNGELLAWRLAARFAFTTHAYGWREGLWSLPRAVVANLIALLAARRAMFAYVRMLRGHGIAWDKTAHAFPPDAFEPAA